MNSSMYRCQSSADLDLSYTHLFVREKNHVKCKRVKKIVVKACLFNNEEEYRMMNFILSFKPDSILLGRLN